MPKKYVSVPTEIEAVRFTYDDATRHGNFAELDNFAGFRNAEDIRIGDPHPKETFSILWDESREGGQVFDNLHHSWINFKNGDWIIRGTKGELYPCDDGVFKEKYRLADPIDPKEDDGFGFSRANTEGEL